MKLKRTNKNRETLSWLFAKTKGQRFKLLILIFSNIAMAGLSVGFALICKGLVDSAVSADKSRLIRYAVYLLAVILGQILLGLISEIVNERATASLAISIQDEMLASFLKNKYSDIIKHHSGELLNRMFSDVSVVVGGMIQLLPSASYLFFRLFGAAAVLVALSPKFTLLFLAAGVLICIFMTLMRKRIKTLHKQVQETGGRVRSYLQEELTSLLVIRAFGAEAQVRNKTLALQENYRKTRFKRRLISMLAGTGFNFIFQMGYFLAMVWGCAGIFQGTLTYGTLTAMLQLVNQIQSPFAGFSGLISQYYTIIASAERIIEIESLPEEVIDDTDRDEYYEELGSIIFENVDFTYGRSQVLEGVNAVIPKGETVSITGISGGGKSTLFLLLMGAYQPTSGNIRIQTKKGEKREYAPVRGLYAYVPQGNYLFSGTLRENVTFLQNDIPDEKVWEALKLSCAEEFVNELPEKLDTPLGEKGHGLSEGQMQRIAIARALLNGAPILLLDEATSALDDETEAKLLRNIQALKNRTCLVVTHRKAALSICNKHLMIKDGKISTEDL